MECQKRKSGCSVAGRPPLAVLHLFFSATTSAFLDLFRSLIGPRWRVVDRDVVTGVGYVKLGFNHVGVKIGALIERMRIVDLHVNNVIAFRDTSNIDPLPAELLEIPVCPSSRNPLRSAEVSMTLIRIKVLQQILKTKRLFVALRRYRAVQIQKLAVRKSQNVVVHLTRRKIK